jgi:pimeloyl-ACP methyl ester carboxylesterase
VSTGAEEVSVRISNGFVLRGLYYGAGSADDQVPLCVCIHGLGVDANVWQFVAPQLQSRGISVLCPDLRSHGLSDQGKWLQLNPNQMARDILSACRNLELEPTVLLAQSFGTYVGLELLREYRHLPAIRALYAVTPVWIGNPKRLLAFLRTVPDTVKFLRGLGRRVGFNASRIPERRDHSRFAEFPDTHMPRLIEEAASISWKRYAKLLVWLRLQSWRASYEWEQCSGYPVRMIVASKDGLWNNRELEIVHRKTGWPLTWMDMKHISLATDAKHADKLIEVLERDECWPRLAYSKKAASGRRLRARRKRN